jgi:O-acetyl-ADP-ribose deacetylase (regulator of RNase III)
MLKRKGDLFTTDAPAIGHGVNCQGLMGAGVAAIFRDKFPKNYNQYKTNCDLKFLRPGESFLYVEDGQPIFNLATQDQPGPDAQYRWVLKAATNAMEQAEQLKLDRIAIPLIGCGIGGLNWEPVEAILHATELSFPNTQWEVWKL